MKTITIKMHGPSISDPTKTVERDVPEVDVQAYRAAGYVEGGLPKAEKAEKAEKVEAVEEATETKKRTK